MEKTNKHKGKLLEYITKVVMKDELENDALVQIIELCGEFLQLKSIQKCADDNGKSYNGIKKTRNVIELFNNKYIIDNQ